MPQSKYNCVSCRRLVDIKQESCPFCNTPNPYLKKVPQEETKKVQDTVGEDLFNDFDTADELTAKPVQAPLKRVSVESKTAAEESKDEDDYILPKQTHAPASEKHAEPKDTASLSGQSDAHEKIEWTDEKKNERTYTSKDMYDEKGKYDANYDGYYDDILPKISNEVDKILQNKEKTILKIIGSVVIIFGIIVYLVVTLN